MTHTDYDNPRALCAAPQSDLTGLAARESQKPATSTAQRIVAVCDEVKEMLLAKNAAYGDSATSPLRIFSRASAEASLLVRIDDKLSRIARGHEYGNDDTVLDLIGYLVLLRATRGAR